MCRICVPSQCRQRQAIGIIGRNGVFADYLALPLTNLHEVPDEISDEEAVFAEPLAAALQIPQSVPVRPEDQAVVLGDGRLGLLVAQVLRLTGADVTLLGHHPERRTLAESWGLRVERPESDVDVVVDCTGRPEGFREALQLVRPRGTLVLKSTYAGNGEFDMSSVVVNEITIVGNRCGPFEPALRLLREGLVDVRSLIDASYPLSQGTMALEHAARRGTLKVLIQP
jgi:threonine dehydrogenase-like Zn-dependent dehydrogenase